MSSECLMHEAGHSKPVLWDNLERYGVPAILIPTCASSSLTFRMVYSAYKLNKQDDNIQPWPTPFPIWNQSVIPCLVLSAASWPAYRLLRRQVKWSGIPISLRIFKFVVIHTIKCFSIVSEAEVDVFLELRCFFYDPMDVGNLTSGSSTLSKSNLNICSWFSYCWDIAWRILIVTLLDVKYGQLCNSLNILWRCPFLGLGWKLTISSPAANAEFSKFAGIWVQHFNSIIF